MTKRSTNSTTTSRTPSRTSSTSSRPNPWPVVAISMIGTSISGVTYISVPGMVAATGMSYLQMVLGFVAGYFVIAYLLLPVYYALRLDSIYSYLGERLGHGSQATGSAFFLISKFLGCGVRMYLTAVVLQVIVFDRIGVPFTVNVALTMLIIWAYTRRGRIRTLVWVDMLQTIAMLLAAGLCAFIIAHRMGIDSWAALTSLDEFKAMSRVWHFDDPGSKQFFWKQFLAGMFTTVAMTGLDQDMMQKNLTCRDLKSARKNVLSYGFAFLPVNMLFLGLGVLLYAFAASLGLSAGPNGDIAPDQLFPTLATRYLPLPVALLFVAGLLAASLSSAGSALNALTTSLTIDLIPLLRKAKGETQDRNGQQAVSQKGRYRLHIANALLMGLLVLAFRLIGNESVINAVYTLASYTYGPLLGLFAYGLFTKFDVRDRAVPWICIASPLVCLVLSSHSVQWWGFSFGFELLLINAAITFCALYISHFGLSASSQNK